MKNMRAGYKASIIGASLLLATGTALATGPAVQLVACPAKQYNDTEFKPYAYSFRGDYNLVSTKVEYSTDGGATWATAINNASPVNDYTYNEPDFTGLPVYISSSFTGTLKVRASASDGVNPVATDTKDVSVYANPGLGAPTRLENVKGTYNYGASWMYDTIDNQEKLWWTAGTQGLGDQIYYSRFYDIPPTVVIARNGYGQYLTSDPTVIRGTFPVEGHTYGYAMCFTQLNPAGDNEIAECFSDDGANWTSPTVKIMSSRSPYMDYGAGFANLIHVMDGNHAGYYMFYTDQTKSTSTVINGVTVYYFKLYVTKSADGVNWNGARTEVTQAGLSGYINGRVAYYDGGADSYWYLAYGGVNVMKIAVDDTTGLPTGSWQSTGCSLSTDKGLTSKSNQGFRHDERGYLHGPNGINEVILCIDTHNEGTGYDTDYWAGQLWYAIMN